MPDQKKVAQRVKRIAKKNEILSIELFYHGVTCRSPILNRSLRWREGKKNNWQTA